MSPLYFAQQRKFASGDEMVSRLLFSVEKPEENFTREDAFKELDEYVADC